MDSVADFNYVAPPTVSDFIACNSPVHLITGPFGSGKSTGCVVKCLMRAQQQQRARDGIRRTKGVVVRNTYRELMDTTKRTIEAWIPAEIRTWVEGEATFYIRFNDVQLELLLRALDTPEDVKKLLSLDITFAWVNEAKQIARPILEGLTGRVGRYPNSEAEGHCSWSGIFMDTNPPDADHWIYKLFEEFENIDIEDRGDYVVFHQPSGLSPDAENIQNLLEGQRKPDGRPLYYARMMVGKTKAWIDVFVHGRYGFLAEGKAVYPEYFDDVHTAKTPLAWRKGLPLVLGMDFGLTPALVVFQRIPAILQWQIIHEIISDNMGAKRFATLAVQELKSKFPGAVYRGYGDPSGDNRGQADEVTAFQVVQAAGLPIDAAPTNDPVRRREAVANQLTTLGITGQPSLIVSPACHTVRRGMNGGYHYKRVQITGEDRFQDLPVKNKYSHPCEAVQYALVGEGMDDSVLSGAAYTDDEGNNPRPKVKTAIKRRSANGRR